jgi:hypothetical protein
MPPLDLADTARFIHERIGPDYHDKKRRKLERLTVDDVLLRKNPYLFRAKATDTAHDFIRAALDATVSSGEETVFGNFMEKVAIHVCAQTLGGRKSAVKGIDLEFERGRTKYLVSITSGPNWGNAGQIENLVERFREAVETLRASGGSRELKIECVEGCCYGTDDTPDKGTHLQLCGQRFWELLSGGSESLYRDLIEPIGHRARERNDELQAMYAAKLNTFTAAFVKRFCDDGVIDWDRLVAYNSGKRRTGLAHRKDKAS